MLERLGQRFRLGVAPGGVALVRSGSWRRSAAVVLAERELGAGSTCEDIAAAVADVLEDELPPGAAVSVVLADDLTRLWQVPPPPGCSRMSDLRAAAAMRFQTLFGAGTAGWRVAADWDASRPFLAAAAPGPLAGAIEAAVRAHRGQVVEMVPQFVAALNTWRAHLRPGAWFGMLQSGVLTLALFDGPSLAAVRAVAVPADASADWLEAQLAREALRLGVARPQYLQLCGPAPASWDGEACTLFAAAQPDLSAPARIACTGSTQ